VGLRILTWNVNSIRVRLDHLARVCAAQSPDVVCLQETKVADDYFPHDAVGDLGFPHVLAHGQKAYNGVAILSRQPFASQGTRRWCGRDDRRHAFVALADGTEVHSIYVPKGGHEPDPDANEKFAHKLRFLRDMAAWAAKSGLRKRKAVLAGDFNVAPLPSDVWDHTRLRRYVGHTPVECAHLMRLIESGGLIDAARHFAPEPAPIYTWWGYRHRDSLKKGYGWRLDHFLVTPPLERALVDCRILRNVRAWTRPSDHAPVVLDLA
jgi:exodeoxyribonuclease-3